MTTVQSKRLLLALTTLIAVGAVADYCQAQRYDPFGDGPIRAPRGYNTPRANPYQDIQNHFDRQANDIMEGWMRKGLEDIHRYSTQPRNNFSITPRMPTPPRRPRSSTPSRGRTTQPQRYTTQPKRYYTQPRVVQQPQTIYKTQPTRNVVTRVQPKVNTIAKKFSPVGNKLASFQMTNLSDARDVVVKESVKASDGLAQGLEEEISNMFADMVNNADPATAGALMGMQDEWQSLLQQDGGPSADEVSDFIARHHHLLSQRGAELLEMHVDVASYRDGLLNGTLSDYKRNRLLDTIGNAADVLNLGWIDNGVESLNDLYLVEQLTDTIPGDSQPFHILLTGAKHADLPMTIVSQMTGVSVYEEPPVTDTTAATPTGVLWNSEKSGQAVNFVLAGEHQTLEPGEEMPLTKSQLVEFDNGQGKKIRYTIGEGSYRWKIEGDQWKLMKTTMSVKIDNSGYEGDFHYVVDNKPGVVAAGETRTHTSQKPIEFRFDRGDGSEARKVLKTGTFRVGVDANEERLDLFDASKVADHAPKKLAEADSDRRARTRDDRVEDLLQQLKSGKRKSSPQMAGSTETAGPIVDF